MSLNITSAFDGGNIIVHSANDPANIRLAIRHDNASDFFQWFYFRVSGAKDQDLHMVLENAKDCLLYTSPSPRDATLSRMPSSA